MPGMKAEELHAAWLAKFRREHPIDVAILDRLAEETEKACKPNDGPSA